MKILKRYFSSVWFKITFGKVELDEFWKGNVIFRQCESGLEVFGFVASS